MIYECPFCKKHFLGEIPNEHDCYILKKKGDRLIKFKMSSGKKEDIKWIIINDKQINNMRSLNNQISLKPLKIK